MSLIPNYKHAIIESIKLRDYILSPVHPTGKFKAKFFKKAGYNQESWERLEKDIKEQHLSKNARKGKVSSFGVKYEITAPLKGSKSIINATSVWIILKGEKYPRLITLIPGGE